VEERAKVKLCGHCDYCIHRVLHFHCEWCEKCITELFQQGNNSKRSKKKQDEKNEFYHIIVSNWETVPMIFVRFFSRFLMVDPISTRSLITLGICLPRYLLYLYSGSRRK